MEKLQPDVLRAALVLLARQKLGLAVADANRVVQERQFDSKVLLSMSRIRSIIKRYGGLSGGNSFLALQRPNSFYAIWRFSTVLKREVDLNEDNKILADGLLRGDRACLARLITLIESQRGK